MFGVVLIGLGILGFFDNPIIGIAVILWWVFLIMPLTYYSDLFLFLRGKRPEPNTCLEYLVVYSLHSEL
jgi:hypothetical protein